MAFSAALRARQGLSPTEARPGDSAAGYVAQAAQGSNGLKVERWAAQGVAADAKQQQPQQHQEPQALAAGPRTSPPSSLEEVLELLHALRDAYSNAVFQREIHELKRKVSRGGKGDAEAEYLRALGPVAAKAQAPVFARFALSEGTRGVFELKRLVKKHSASSDVVEKLGGDLRELLGLPREEVVIGNLWSHVEEQLSDTVNRFRKAPPEAVTALATALGLASDASAEELSRVVPQISQIARQRAKKLCAEQPRTAIVGEGRPLPATLSGASDQELEAHLAEQFQRYLQKMLTRCLQPVEAYTTPPEDWRCTWASALVETRHVLSLWGKRQANGLVAHGAEAIAANEGGDWATLGVGIAVIDNVIDESLIWRAHAELKELDVSVSENACNVGARSAWLDFSEEERRRSLPPALAEVALKLAGLPDALLRRAQACRGSLVELSKLRVHPHVMAAVYDRGAQYFGHKDSYGGSDNNRSLTVLLYTNPDWEEGADGDGGDLRVFAGEPPSRSGKRAGEPGSSDAAYVDIAPLPGRLVIFRSREVWHAVREPRRPRWALTLWVMAD